MVIHSAQKVELTDFCKNLEGKERKLLVKKSFLSNFKEKVFISDRHTIFFPNKQQLVYWPPAMSCPLLIFIGYTFMPYLLTMGFLQKSFHIILYTGGFSNLTPSNHKYFPVVKRKQARRPTREWRPTMHPLPVLQCLITLEMADT